MAPRCSRFPCRRPQAPHVARRFRSIYIGTMAAIMLLFTAFAISNYLYYGSDMDVIITMDLPDATWRGQVVRLLYCVAVIFTFPLMLFPVTKMCVLAAGFDDKARTGRIVNNLLRVALVLSLALIAIVEVNARDHIVSLLGCVASTPLALVLPPLMHLKAVQQSFWSAIVNKVVIVFGAVITVVTTTTTLVTWRSASS